MRSWLKQGAAALLVLLLVELALSGFFLRDDGWHVELRVMDYECPAEGPCRFKPGVPRELEGPDGRYVAGINALGFRGPLPPEVRAPGAVRVAVIGSSPVFGLGVPDDATLPVQLERALAAAEPAVPFEVVNLGLPENYLLSNLATFRDVARPLAPDLVVFVQPDLVRLVDINQRIRQIQGSPLLQSLLGSHLGRGVVNRYQYTSMAFLQRRLEGGEGALAGPLFSLLAEDQAARCTSFVFFKLWEPLGSVAAHLPAALRYRVVETGHSEEAFRAQPWVFPDGHPRPEGHRLLAAQLAEAVRAELAERRARPPCEVSGH